MKCVYKRCQNEARPNSNYCSDQCMPTNRKDKVRDSIGAALGMTSGTIGGIASAIGSTLGGALGGAFPQTTESEFHKFQEDSQMTPEIEAEMQRAATGPAKCHIDVRTREYVVPPGIRVVVQRDNGTLKEHTTKNENRFPPTAIRLALAGVQKATMDVYHAFKTHEDKYPYMLVPKTFFETDVTVQMTIDELKELQAKQDKGEQEKILTNSPCKLPDLTEKQVKWMRKKNRCWDCKSDKGFLEGPSGGACTNIKCANCGSKFNVHPFGIDRI